MSALPQSSASGVDDAYLESLAAEAEAADVPGTSLSWQNATDEERPRILTDAALTRSRLAAQLRPQLPTVRVRLGAHYLGELAAGEPEPLLLGRLDPRGHTILHGAGGSGKGTVATYWIAELVAVGHRVLILDYESHPDEWARRYRGLSGNDPGSNVLHVSPLSATWQGKRGALWEQEDDIRELAEAFEATYIVVDSIVPGCGGADPIDPGTAARYAAAIEYIGRPVLSLAHVPKSGGLDYPYGSTFWHALARVTWSLQRDGERMLLVNRKSNNYAKAGRFSIAVTWWEGAPRDVFEQGYTLALSDRIDEALGSAAMTVSQIVAAIEDTLEDDETAPPADSIRKTLRRGIKADPARYAAEGVGLGARYRKADA